MQASTVHDRTTCMNAQSDDLFRVEQHRLGLFGDDDLDSHLPIERECFEIGFEQQIVFGGGHLKRVHVCVRTKILEEPVTALGATRGL